MKIHLLSGFLGSGKTTAIQQACNQLSKKQRVAVITNDQGIRLVDGGFFEHLNIPNRQVVNGCFCCNYNDLDGSIQSLMIAHQPDIIFAESVGSCTDIIATVMKPLLLSHPEMQVTVSTFADIRLLKMLLKGGLSILDESVRYIYFKQLEEAGVIVVSKTDLIDPKSLEEIKQLMKENYGSKIILYQNSYASTDVQRWLGVLADHSFEKPSSLQINYAIYGEGEARLAWYDQEIEIFSNDNNAIEEAITIMKEIYKKIDSENYFIGHLKFLLNEKIKVSFTATSSEGVTDKIIKQKSGSSLLLINARVQTTPKILSHLISEAIREVELKSGCKTIVIGWSSFQPVIPNLLIGSKINHAKAIFRLFLSIYYTIKITICCVKK